MTGSPRRGGTSTVTFRLRIGPLYIAACSGPTAQALRRHALRASCWPVTVTANVPHP